MTPHDPSPIYNTVVLLKLLRLCVSGKGYLFYAKILSEHDVSPPVGTADGARAELLRHLFSGCCVLQHSTGCREVVSGEKWSHPIGIKMIDLTCQWVDEGKLTTDDLGYICEALDGVTYAGQQRRSLLSKLANRRRLLVSALDVASASLEDTARNVGSSSKLSTVRATCAAHDIPVSQSDDRADLVDKVFEHVAGGNCAEKHAAGCERVMEEASPAVSDVIHAQLSVLHCLEQALSTNQLRKVLDLHGIAFDDGDSKRKLKFRLRTYIRQLQNGKVREADAERELAERLQKLEVLRKNWPKLIPPQMKERLISDFKDATSSNALASFTCACCARELLLKERQCKNLADVNISKLRAPSDHWDSPGASFPPTPFSTGPLENVLVDSNGVKSIDDGSYRLDLCTSCLNSLRRDTMPKHALANRLYLGPVPEELRDLTMVEECMIARARAKSWIVKLQETDTDSASPIAQRGLKGHTIIYPQQPDGLATMLPPPIGDTLTFICIIFVGNSTLTKEWLRDKAKPLAVRREKVYKALTWLKENNPLYRDVEISEENIRSLPVDDVLPYHIEQIAPDNAQETLTSGYDNRSENREALPHPPHGDASVSTHYESVVMTDVDAHTPATQLRAAAVRHAKTNGRPFVQVGHGSSPSNEFFNVNLFPALYPTLFPYGCGGFEDSMRRKPISLKEHVKYLFSLRGRRFQTHYSFLFTAFNILQRRALLLHASLKVKRTSFAKFARDFSSVSSEAVGGVLQQVEKGEHVVPRTDEERRVLRLMKEVNLVTARVPGSSAARVAMRNEIRALTTTHGVPSFYITINPADTLNPVVKFLSEGNIDIDDMLENEVPNFWEQSLLVASNPAIGAKFFNLYLKAFLRIVLGYSDDDPNNDGGVLGRVKAHYGCVEAQGRGSLHCHMLVWLEGALNPDEIRQRVMQDPDWGQKLLEYLDDTITNVVPADPIPDSRPVMFEKDPCTTRGADLKDEDLDTRLSFRRKDLHRLAERVQKHRHTHTCYKYYKPGEARTCRFDLKEDNFKPSSCVDPETGNVSLRCLDGLVNNFNATILEAVRCNMDIQFIGSGESAKAMIYYITDYITKSQLKSHVAYAALQLAVKKCENIEDGDDDFTLKSKRLLQKAAYAMISHQEMSAQQVASYLMDCEDHFTSHSFSNLYWRSFERLIDRDDPLAFRDKRTGMGNGGSGGERELVEEVDERDSIDSGADDVRYDQSDEMAQDDDDEAEISIAIGQDGSVNELADQVSDYTLRAEEMRGLCLWDFVATVEKLRGNRSLASGDTIDISDVDEEPDIGSDGDDDDSEPPDSEVVENREDTHTGKRHGRKPITRYHFLAGHKECDRKYMRFRKREIVPVPIGPSIPRRDQPDVYERYCRLMLILFKPWRLPVDLREPGEGWSNAFAEFARTADAKHKQVIDNMQILHECRDSRDDHMQTRARGREKAGYGRAIDDNWQGENEIEDIDMGEVLEHLSEIDRMSSKRTDAMNRETEQCIGELERAGWYDGTQLSALDGDHPTTAGIHVPDDETVEDEWKDAYEKRKASWRVEARECEVPEKTGEAMKIVQMQDVERVVPVVNDAGSAPNASEEAFDAVAAMRDTIEKWTLNEEQRKAFEIVARHTTEDKPKQLLMYLGGPGGTGKSRVVNALRDFFALRNESRRFRLAAYTGVAARNIGGATLHALLQMNETGWKRSSKTKNGLAAMWDGIDYLFVDEHSMLGCETMHNVSSALTEAKGNTAAFGGVNMIFAGDFAQLPPIGDVRLYKNIDTTKAAMGTTNRAQAKVLGRLLWLSVDTVVILHETMRQAGSENSSFVDLLHRLRSGSCSTADYALLKSRILKNIRAPADPRWHSAPVIVTNNTVRDAVNRRATEAFAKATGGELHWYHAIDTHKKNLITDPALIESLEAQHSGQTKHRLRRVPLVIGMPVAVNQNFDVRGGVVNGSWGFLRAVRFSTDGEGRRHLKSCVVEIPGADAVEMPHLPKHHFPILADTTDITFEHSASHKRCVIKRKQVPIQPGFAMTTHKAQGQTMGMVVVDLAGCSGTEQPYVMVSRSTSMQGLIILRDFDFSVISKRRSEDLRKEFARLEDLRLQTNLQIGSDDQVRETTNQNERQKRKRGEGEDRVRRKKSRI